MFPVDSLSYVHYIHDDYHSHLSRCYFKVSTVDFPKSIQPILEWNRIQTDPTSNTGYTFAKVNFFSYILLDKQGTWYPVVFWRITSKIWRQDFETSSRSLVNLRKSSMTTFEIQKCVSKTKNSLKQICFNDGRFFETNVFQKRKILTTFT